MTKTEKYKIAFNIAITALAANKFRSFLTALGIIFGVAAVISMLAIGTGAKQEILEQMKLVGVNNIIISKKVETEESSTTTSSKKNSDYSPGLSVKDVDNIKEILPSVHMISPEVVYQPFVLRKGVGKNLKLIGVSEQYFKMFNYQLISGKFFTKTQLINSAPVCVIGKSVKTKFFSKENPIGKMIKCKHIWLRVIGVFKTESVNEGTMTNLGVRDYNQDIYTPYTTAILRYKNRTLINQKALKKESTDSDEGTAVAIAKKPKAKKHQIDKIIIQVDETGKMRKTAEILSRFLQRRHRGVVDYEIHIPELQLKQQQKEKENFNIVLGAIAAISLLVGGIGIMNIMLASVMERIREIGLRISVGATKQDIITQFLMESIFLSVGGGIIGVLLGILIAKLIMWIGGVLTIVSFLSIVVSFGVSATVGLVFGLMPAKKAAEQNPVDSLRA